MRNEDGGLSLPQDRTLAQLPNGVLCFSLILDFQGEDQAVELA